MNTKTLKLNPLTANYLEGTCKTPPGTDVGRGETLFDEGVWFNDHVEMVIQVVASDNPDVETCWTQGVLFIDGNEAGCTDVGGSVLGDFTVGAFRVTVEAANIGE